PRKDQGFRGLRTETGANLRLALFDLPKRTLQLGEIARVQDLNACIVFSVEWSDRRRTARGGGISRRIEPETQMVLLHWIGLRVAARVGRKNNRGWRNTGCDSESLYAEDADEISNAKSIVIGLNVALIP